MNIVNFSTCDDVIYLAISLKLTNDVSTLV